MLTGLMHRIAANAWVYDQIQRLAGNQLVLGKLGCELSRLDPRVVVDVGGGTGAIWNSLKPSCRYICIDLEMPKLRGFRSKLPEGLAIVGDATLMPIDRGCADVVLCKSVTHHLTDSQLEQSLSESQRVLRPGGHFLLFDAVWSPKRLAGRILWKLDRGSYPRTAEQLREKLESRFRVVQWEKFAIYHEYVFAVGARL